MSRQRLPESAATRLFRGTVSDDELVAFESVTTAINVPAGTVLMRQGAFGNEAVMVLDGELLVERDGEVVAMVGPGAALGEQALLLDQPRNATVSAATDAVVAVMSRSEFLSMLDRCPTIGRNILETALTRVAHPN